jgi:hypothetical protein
VSLGLINQAPCREDIWGNGSVKVKVKVKVK